MRNDSQNSVRRPHVLLAASGSVAAIKFENLCRCFSEWAEVRAVTTKSALHFIDTSSLTRDTIVYTDDDEWCTWNKIGDAVLHIELRKWADLMVIAPLSANTLGKVFSLKDFSFLISIHLYSYIRMSILYLQPCFWQNLNLYLKPIQAVTF